ncbi:Glutamate decarboxylase 2, partial [Coemansia sp. RSA 2618]
GIWDDVRAVCAGATNTWSSQFLYKLYAAPTPIGVVGETLLGVLNNNAHVIRASPSGAAIEHAVATKLAQLAQFPATAGGLTFPGGSYSNLHALMTARNTRFPHIQQRGLQGTRLSVFTSAHAHYSIDKAAVAAGIGLDNVVRVPTDADGRMDVSELRRLMRAAAARESEPFFVNATMGTTVLGACDPVAGIAAVCAEFSAWLHVDGAWGGPLALFADVFEAPGAFADSFTVNPHKLLGVPQQCSFLLVRRGIQVMHDALGLRAGYLFHEESDPSRSGDADLLYGDDGPNRFTNAGDATLGCGRRPDAVKFWLMWRYYGTQYFSARVQHARSMALRLAALVRSRLAGSGRWELVAEPPGTCVCFWFVHRTMDTSREQSGAATRRICDRINDAGKMMLDYASVDRFVDGKFDALPEFFRIPVNSPAVTEETLCVVLDAIEQTAIELFGK